MSSNEGNWLDRARQRREEEEKKKTNPTTSNEGAWLDRARQRRKEEDVRNVDADYINLFINASNDYLSSAEDDYSNVGWSNAHRNYQIRSETKNDLDNRQRIIRSWLDTNKQSLSQDDYNNISGALDNYEANATGVLNAFSAANDYYSQWNTEEDYQTAVRYDGYRKKYDGQDSNTIKQAMSILEDGEEKDWLKSYAYEVDNEEKSRYDLASGKQEINALWAQVEDLEKSKIVSAPYIASQTDYLGNNQYAAAKQDPSQIDKEIYRLKGLISEKQSYWDQAKYIQDLAEWNSVTGNADFEKKSQYVANFQYGLTGKPSFTDATYAYVNNPLVEDKRPLGGGSISARNLINTEDASFKADTLGRHTDSSYVKDALDLMNEDEVKVYNYYYATDGKEKAQEYLDFITSTLKERRATQNAQTAAKFADEHPWLASGASVPISLSSGFEHIGNSLDYLGNKMFGKDAKMAMNESALATNAIRQTVSDKVDWEIGNWDAFDFLYNTTMSGLDSAAAMGFGGAGGAVLGLSAAAQGTNDALERGMSSDQAFWNGLASGVFEGLFETMSIGNFKKLTEVAPDTFKDIAKNLGKSMLVNASEETATEIANIAYDTLMNGEFANYTIEDLKNGKWKEALAQVIEAGASGALMGFGMGTVGNTIGHYKGYADQYGDFTDALIARGLESDAGSDVYKLSQKYQKLTEGESGKPLNGVQIKKLVKATENQLKVENAGEMVPKAKERLEMLGEAENIDVIADLAAKRASGQKMTRAEKSTLARSRFGAQVAKELETNAAVYKPLEKRVGTERKYGVSESGQDTVIESGKEIDLSRAKVVDFVKDKETGEVVDLVIAADGEEVNASDIAYSDDSKSYLFEAVGKIENITPEDATVIIRDYDPASGLTVGEYLNGMDEGFSYGYNHYSMEDLKAGNFTPKLGDTLANSAYILGQNAKKLSGKNASEGYKRMRTAAQALAEKNAQAAQSSTDGFVGGYSGTTYNATQAGLLASVSTEGLQNAADLSGKQDVTFNHIGINDQQTKQQWVDAGLAYVETDADGNEYYVVNDAMLMDERDRRHKATKAVPKSKKLTITYNHGGGVIEDIATAGEKISKQLNKEQRGGIEAAKILHQMGIGTDFELFTSYRSNTLKDKDGKPLEVFLDDEGKEQAAYAGVYMAADGKIRINLNAYSGTKGLTLNALSHELTHFIKTWSLEKYETMAEFLVKSYGEHGVSMHQLVLKEQARLEGIRGKAVSYGEAYDEVVANAFNRMLEDGKVMERIAEIRQVDKSLADKIIEGIRKFIKRFTDVYRKNQSLFHETEALMEMKKVFEQLQEMFAEALVDASDNFQASLIAKEAEAVKSLGENAKVETNAEGELLLASNESGNVLMYSENTYLNGGREKLEMALRQNGHTAAEIKQTLSYVDDALDYIKILAAGYAKNMGYSNLSDHLVADIVTNVKTGKQVMSAIVNNGDYPVNIDLSLICKKRVAYMNLMSRLIRDGVFDKVNYDGAAIAEVNEILRENGFETACLGCFVESRRLQFQTWAETIVSEWNTEVEKRNPNAGSFGFAKGKMENLTDADIDALTRELESVKKNDQGNVNLGQGNSVTRMGRLLDALPSLQKKLTVEDLLTPKGLTALRKHDGSLFSIVKSRYGAASPKIVQDFNPYASEIAMLTFAQVKGITNNAVKGAQAYVTEVKSEYGKVKKAKGESKADFDQRKKDHEQSIQDEAMRRYLYDIGGARIQSFSDFMIENVFDYIQIFADLAAKRLPLHGYTKEIVCMRLFGMTGAMWNGSLIAHVERSMGKEYAGLLPAGTKDGIPVTVDGKDYVIGFDDYARNFATGGKSFIQSIGMKDVIALQLDPRYSPYVGNITIGVSDAQILAMLDNPLFRMVIPYHASGMLPMFAKLVGVDMYNDYTDYQNTTVRQYYDVNGNAVSELKNTKGEAVKADTSYAFNAEIQKTKDAKTAANSYLKWCAQRHPVYDGSKLVGYATFNPKFSNSPYGTDFTRHENYYKLLEDFNTYDSVTEASTVQGAVTMNFPSEENRLTAQQMEAYKAALRETGIFTEKDIDKYAKKADMTFKEIINSEVGNRANYAKTQNPRWESTVKAVEAKLQKDYAREQYSSQQTDRDRQQYNPFRERFAKERLDLLSDQLGNLFPLSAGFEQAIQNDETPVSNMIVVANSQKKANGESFYTAAKNAFKAVYGEKTTFSIKQLGITADADDSFARESISKEGHAKDRQTILDLTPEFKQLIEESRLLAVERTRHNDNKKTSLLCYRLYNAYIRKEAYIDASGIKQTHEVPHIVVFNVVQNLNDAKAHMVTDIKDVAIRNGHNSSKLKYAAHANGNISIDNIADVYGVVKGVERKKGGLHYSEDDERVYGFNYSQKNSGELYSTQETDNITNRHLLANAFEGISQNSDEYKMIRQYKGHIAELNSLENKLSEFNREIRKIRFGKGEYDAEKLARLEDEARKIAEAINKHDKKLLSMEASEPLRKVIDRERKKEAQKTKDHVKQIQDNKKVRAEQAELRHKIRKAIRDLDKILKHGNKQRNVKEDMKGFVSKTLELADYLFTDHISNDDLIRRGITVSMRGNEPQLVKETEDILNKLYDQADGLTDEEFTRLDEKRKRNMEKLRDLLKSQRNERLNTPVYNLFNDVVTEYSKLQNSKQDAVKAAYNVDLENTLRSLMGDADQVDRLKNMRVADMTTKELENLLKAYKMVLSNVRDADKIHAKVSTVTIGQMADRISNDFGSRKIPEKDLAIAVQKITNKIGWDYEKLYYALHRIGSGAFTELFMNLANSENIVMQDVREAHDFLDKMLEKHKFNDWAFHKEVDHEFMDNTGKKFKLTLGQAMALYAYSRREGAWKHLEYGGFAFGKAALTNPRPADTYKLNRAQCEAITSLLTAEQKAYVDEMQAYLSDVMGAKGNEVSMKLYGVELFGEENYFPIHVAGQYMARAEESEAKASQGFQSMSNAGFTHTQNRNAMAPIVMEGFNEIWVDHVNEMSRYHGAVPALEDIRRVMNRSTYSDSKGNSTAIKAQMINAFGEESAKYFDNLYREANSGAIQDKLQATSKKLLSKFRKNSVAYSLSVLIQQPASITRAYAMIDKKYFGIKGFGAISSGVAKAMSDKWTKAHTDAYNEMLKYAPGVTMAKEIGGFDTATGGSIRSYLLDTNKSLKQKWKTGTIAEKGNAVMNLVDNNAVANLPNVADKIAWIEIWNACKREGVARNKNLKPGSDEFLQAVGDRFTEVIRATQVYDSIFAKSPMLKSKSLAVQYLVNFANEPNTVANMVEKAVRDVAKGDWKQGTRAAVVLVNSIVFTNLLKSMVYAMRDDDEDENYIEKYIEAVVGNLMSDFNPLSYLPIGRDVLSLAQGYDVERPDMAILADVIEAYRKRTELNDVDTEDMTEEKLIELEKKVTEANWKLAESVASFFGIPVKNIRRDVMGIINTVTADVQKSTGMSIRDTVYDALNGGKSKQDKLYAAIVDGDQTYLGRLKAGYKTDDSYNSAVRKALRENDPRIREAAVAWNANDLDEYMRIAKKIIAEKHFSQDNVVMAIRAEADKLAPDEASTTTSKAKGLFTAEKFAEAIAQGDQAMANAVKSDIIATAKKNGKTADEAENSFNSSAKGDLKELYLDGKITDSKALNALVTYCGMEQDEAEEAVGEWAFEDEYGFTFSDCGDAYKSGKISAYELKEILMDVSGKTEEEADLQIQAYDWEKEGHEGVTAAAVREYNEHCDAANVPKDVYLYLRKFKNGTTNTVDEKTGKEINYSAIRKVLAEIHAQPNLTPAQKTAIAYGLGYAERSIRKYKQW